MAWRSLEPHASVALFYTLGYFNSGMPEYRPLRISPGIKCAYITPTQGRYCGRGKAPGAGLARRADRETSPRQEDAVRKLVRNKGSARADDYGVGGWASGAQGRTSLHDSVKVASAIRGKEEMTFANPDSNSEICARFGGPT